jgi:transposase-like protein
MHSKETRIEFHRLAVSGTRYEEIATRLEIGLTAIYRWRRELRIKSRKRGRKKVQNNAAFWYEPE